ncbi:MAG: carboxymuconolactone decarboxylase family protein [Dehalococcoidia bacterium]|nr:carboxymuconolactone decarboxylase family protein [Dehalococcoidia bacterium]
MTDSESIAKGRAVLKRLRGVESPGGTGSVTDEMFFDDGQNRRDFADFWRVTQGHLFGEVWSRPGLALRDRSMITMVVLTVLASTEELKGHMRYALNNGIAKEEILEMIMHVAHYAGWPAAVNALRVVKEAFED